MAREPYAAQVALLVRLLPFIAAEKIFALKGGTAINLFYRDMPRLRLPTGGRVSMVANFTCRRAVSLWPILTQRHPAHARPRLRCVDGQHAPLNMLPADRLASVGWRLAAFQNHCAILICINAKPGLTARLLKFHQSPLLPSPGGPSNRPVVAARARIASMAVSRSPLDLSISSALDRKSALSAVRREIRSSSMLLSLCLPSENVPGVCRFR